MLRCSVAYLQFALLDGEQHGGAISEVLRIKSKIVFLVDPRQCRPQRAHGANLETFAKSVGRICAPRQYRRQSEPHSGCAQHLSKVTSSDAVFGHNDVSLSLRGGLFGVRQPRFCTANFGMHKSLCPTLSERRTGLEAGVLARSILVLDSAVRDRVAG